MKESVPVEVHGGAGFDVWMDAHVATRAEDGHRRPIVRLRQLRHNLRNLEHLIR